MPITRIDQLKELARFTLQEPTGAQTAGHIKPDDTGLGRQWIFFEEDLINLLAEFTHNNGSDEDGGQEPQPEQIPQNEAALTKEQFSLLTKEAPSNSPMMVTISGEIHDVTGVTFVVVGDACMIDLQGEFSKED